MNKYFVGKFYKVSFLISAKILSKYFLLFLGALVNYGHSYAAHHHKNL